MMEVSIAFAVCISVGVTLGPAMPIYFRIGLMAVVIGLWVFLGVKIDERIQAIEQAQQELVRPL